MQNLPRMDSGMIIKFDCCCEGKHILWSDSLRKFVNQDAQDVKGKENHFFLIISKEEQNKREGYITVIPITSSDTSYNTDYSLPVSTEMVNEKAQSLVSNGSYFKIGHPTRIFKNHITLDKDGNYDYIGDVYSAVMPNILSKMSELIG